MHNNTLIDVAFMWHANSYDQRFQIVFALLMKNTISLLKT